MSRNDYVETLVVNDKLVNVGLDDYGQSYYFEYYDEKQKKLVEVGCGTYNENYRQEIEDYFKSDIELMQENIRMLFEEVRDINHCLRDILDKLGMNEEKTDEN